MKYEDLLYEKHGSVAVATLNRPGSLNAFREQTFREFTSVLEDSAADDEVLVLVITGNGRAFSAGEDLKELASQLEQNAASQEWEQRLEDLQEITRLIINHPKVIVTAINGISVGFGVELAIASDLRLAAEEATFAFLEVKRGLFPTNGVTYLLPRIVGHGRAASMLLTGKKFSAREALDAGLVTQVVPKDNLLGSALEEAKAIAGNAPISVRLIRDALRRGRDSDLEGALKLEIEGMLECLENGDVVEGTQSFMEGRAPNRAEK